MKALLFDEQIIQVFKVTDDQGEELLVTWNKDNHTEDDMNKNPYIPEFVVEDSAGEELEQGCLDWLEAVEAVKQWI